MENSNKQASPAAQSGAVDDLLPLPKKAWHWVAEQEGIERVEYHHGYQAPPYAVDVWEPLYTADQMQDYACAAVELSRAQAAQQAQPVSDEQHVINLLVDVARNAFCALDDTCEDENGLHWDEKSHDDLSEALDKLDELPDDQPGYVMGPAAKAEWALRALLSQPAAPASEQPAFPERDPSKTAEQQGMFRKFEVRRVDGSDQPGGKHHGCRYFVLDLDHDPAAPAGMLAYAAKVRATHPQLADDIEAKFGEQPAAQTAGVTDEMVRAYLDANDAYWKECDALPKTNPSKWRNGTPREATAISLRAAIAAAPQPVAEQVGEQPRTKTTCIYCGARYVPPIAQVIPDGLALVPIKLTHEMIEAAANADPERESLWDVYLSAVHPQAAQAKESGK